MMGNTLTPRRSRLRIIFLLDNISPYRDDPYLWLTKYTVVNRSKKSFEVLISHGDCELKVGGIITVSAYMKTLNGIQYYSWMPSYWRKKTDGVPSSVIELLLSIESKRN
jgi:hypothetical protein